MEFFFPLALILAAGMVVLRVTDAGSRGAKTPGDMRYSKWHV